MSKKPKGVLSLMFLFDKSMYGNEEPIYIYIENPFILKLFFKQTEEEGITFVDGSPVSSRDGLQIYKFYPNGTVSNLGLGCYFKGMSFFSSISCVRINYSKYLSGNICCNEPRHNRHPQPYPRHSKKWAIEFCIDCRSISLQEKQDLYNFLIDNGFVSWSSSFFESNFISLSLQDKIFSFEDDCKKSITIQEFYTVFDIFNKY